MTFQFSDKQGVDLWYDDDGNLLRVLPRPWTPASRRVAVEHGGGKAFGSPEVSPSSNSSTITPLVMMTTGGARRPQSGYLLPAAPAKSSARHYIKVTLPYGKDVSDNVKLTLGLLSDAMVGKDMIAVSAKQTKRQCWLQEIWQAAHALHDEKYRAEKSSAAASFSTLDCSDLEGLDIQRLVIMLLWQHWIDSKVSDEAKIADLKELGLPGLSGKNSIWTIISRMELEKCQVPTP